MRISDWSSDVCSSDLQKTHLAPAFLCRLRQLAEALAPRLARAFHFRLPHFLRDALNERVVHALQAQIVRDPRGAVFACQRMRKIGRASCRERVCQYV